MAKRNDRPDGIAFLLRNYPQLSDAQIGKLMGTTKETIDKVRSRTHWNSANIKPRDPVILGLCSQSDLHHAVMAANDRLTREGRWAEKTSHMAMGLTGRTLGLVGVGNIGAEVFRLAQPFEMKHIAYDPAVRPGQLDGLGVEMVDSLDEVMRRSDFVSINCPLNAHTRGLIGAREIALMKPTAFLINTARGPIVQERALYEALAARRIGGAGLDVFEVEPTPKDNPLLALDNVIVTPHGLCFTDECFTGIARNTFEAVRALADGRAPRYIVNPEALQHPALAGLAA